MSNDDFLKSITKDLNELETIVDGQEEPTSTNQQNSNYSMDNILSEIDNLKGLDFEDGESEFFNITKESLAKDRKNELSMNDLVNVGSDFTIIQPGDGKFIDDLTPTPQDRSEDICNNENNKTNDKKEYITSSSLKTNTLNIIDESKEKQLETIWKLLEETDQPFKKDFIYISDIPIEPPHQEPQESVLNKINTNITNSFTSLWNTLQSWKPIEKEQSKSEQIIIETDEKEQNQLKTEAINDPLLKEIPPQNIIEKETSLKTISGKKFQPPIKPHEITPYEKELTAQGYIYILNITQLIELVTHPFNFPGLILHDIILRFIPEQNEFFLTKGSKSDFDILPNSFSKPTLVQVFALSKNFYVVYIAIYDEYYLTPNSPIVIPNAQVRYVTYCELSKLTSITTQFDSITSYLSNVDKKMGDSILSWAKSWF
ncbi:hypothetical protein EDI_246180 [Entamoeba dispar SAW760]|uniref:Uncharacterized protein n=1 Tax=Entamoeba dispar (strain ATCC PRA-260 / SAW760) TaxID=370354 RepID=B0EEM6_ENTDS|nr:uncharacterized protein EDI_246180 [Entamoeba dispar SAW760]EDR27002.1 hypothetical protein EDI_246180 [Entamoeba dispar SAW760]|eukprot:EDR27002.1 hypothetical protein EDI_246180 [Entamoeba dispar SAW760]